MKYTQKEDIHVIEHKGKFVAFKVHDSKDLPFHKRRVKKLLQSEADKAKIES